MDEESVLARAKQLIREANELARDEVSLGRCVDLGAYKRVCGEIRGREAALEMIEQAKRDVLKQEDEDDD